MKLLKGGSRRTVILIGRYAFKFPSFESFDTFAEGLIHNISEYRFSMMKLPELCPVIFHIPGGLLNVMPRCDLDISDDRKMLAEWQKLAEKSGMQSLLNNIVETKKDSVGRLPNGRVVAVDYAAPLVKIVYVKEAI